MKANKRDFIPFSFYDRTGMERHFAKRAAQGWLLEEISPWCWKYRAIPPRQMHFTVTYYLRASSFDPEPTEEQQTFHDFCAHTGWQLAAASGQMQVFYNDREDPLPIETEPEMELRTIGKMARKVLPIYVILLVIGFLMGGSWCWSLRHSPIDLLASPTSMFSGLCWLGLFLYSAADLISYFTWRRRAKKAAKTGEFIPTRGCHWLLIGAVGLLFVGGIYFFFTARLPGLRLLTAGMILAFLILFWAVNGTKEFLKRRKVSRNRNRVVTLTVDVLLAFVLMGGVTAGLLWGIRSGAFSLEEQLTAPLSAEDLTGVEDERYVERVHYERSLFLSQFTCRQYTPFDPEADLPGLEYTVVEVSFPWLYQWCREELLGEWNNTGEYQYREADPVPWSAEAAYQLYAGDMARNCYLLCWEKRLVKLETDWDLTEEQMALAAEKLQAYQG